MFFILIIIFLLLDTKIIITISWIIPCWIDGVKSKSSSKLFIKVYIRFLISISYFIDHNSRRRENKKEEKMNFMQLGNNLELNFIAND